MSALPPKADVDRHDGHVRLVPLAHAVQRKDIPTNQSSAM